MKIAGVLLIRRSTTIEYFNPSYRVFVVFSLNASGNDVFDLAA